MENRRYSTPHKNKQIRWQPLYEKLIFYTNFQKSEQMMFGRTNVPT